MEDKKDKIYPEFDKAKFVIPKGVKVITDRLVSPGAIYFINHEALKIQTLEEQCVTPTWWERLLMPFLKEQSHYSSWSLEDTCVEFYKEFRGRKFYVRSEGDDTPRDR